MYIHLIPAFYTWCEMLIKEPVIAIKDVSLCTFSLQSLALDVIVSVENPNLFGITLTSISFDIFYRRQNEWVFLCHGEKTGFKITSGTHDVPMPVTVKNTALLAALAGMVLHGEITVRITGVAKPSLLLYTPTVPFTREMTIPLELPIGGK